MVNPLFQALLRNLACCSNQSPNASCSSASWIDNVITHVKLSKLRQKCASALLEGCTLQNPKIRLTSIRMGRELLCAKVLEAPTLRQNEKPDETQALNPCSRTPQVPFNGALMVFNREYLGFYRR